MVLLTVVTTSNPHTLYFDHPIEKPNYIRLLSASLYNSWHNLKEEATIYANNPNKTLEVKFLPGHYTIDSLVNAFNDLSKENPKFTISVDIKEGFWHTKICATFNRKFKRKIVISYF